MAGLRTLFENIDNRGDFKVFMQNYAVAHAAHANNSSSSNVRILRRYGPSEEGYVSFLLYLWVVL